MTRLCSFPEIGVTFPLKEHYEKVNADIFDPRITTEDYEPQEDALRARAPSFDEDLKDEDIKEEVKGELNAERKQADPDTSDTNVVQVYDVLSQGPCVLEFACTLGSGSKQRAK